VAEECRSVSFVIEIVEYHEARANIGEAVFNQSGRKKAAPIARTA